MSVGYPIRVGFFPSVLFGSLPARPACVHSVDGMEGRQVIAGWRGLTAVSE